MSISGIVAERIEAFIGHGVPWVGLLIDSNDVVGNELILEDWIIQSAEINPGYGISRLFLRLKEFYPKESEGWNEGKLNTFIARNDRLNGTSLLDLLTVNDDSTGRPRYITPGNNKKKSIISQDNNQQIEVRKEVKPINNDFGNIELSSLSDPKHKIAYLLINSFGDYKISEDHYGRSGTVTKPYLILLSEKLNLRIPARPTKHGLIEEIFVNCTNFDFDKEKYTSSNGTVTKRSFIDLCDSFGVSLPENLVGELDEYEENYGISLNLSVQPDVDARMETIQDIIDDFVGGTIFVPSFQRNFRWPIKKQRELIDSILLGIPLPSVLLIEASAGDWWLVDGRQRITSLRRFIKPKDYTNKNTFHLGLLDGENSRYSNMHFNELEDAVQKRILETKIPVTFIKGLSEHKDAVYELFRRYNTGGTNLNGAEIRHAVFHENNFHIALFELAGEDRPSLEYTNNIRKVRKLIRVGSKSSGYKAYDIICRYFGYLYSPKGLTTSNAIFNFFENNEGRTKEEATELTNQFIECAEFTDSIFGEELRFNRLKEDGTKGGFAAWPYTIQMIGSTHLIHNYPDELNQIKNMRDEIIDLWKKFYFDEVFNVRQNSTTLWGSQEKWRKELELWIEKRIKTELSEFEIILNELHVMDPLNRKDFIEILKEKDYYHRLIKEAKFQGWLEK